MCGTFCNMLMVLEMSREPARKSLSPSPSLGWSGHRDAASGETEMLFISSVEWDDSRRREYFYCSVWLHLPRVRCLKWSLSTNQMPVFWSVKWSLWTNHKPVSWPEANVLFIALELSAQLEKSFTLKAMCHSNFQIGRVNNFWCNQRWTVLKITANEVPRGVLMWPMRGRRLRRLLWCLDVIVSKHFEIEFVLARRASAKCTKLSVLSNCKTFYLTFWKLLRPLEWSVKSCMSAHHFLSLSFCAVAAVRINLEE